LSDETTNPIDDTEISETLGAPVRPGEILAGKYRIDRVLGAGGMGVVVAATHLELNDRVAVKFLLPHALVNEEATRRFVREARAAVRIKSEHVARVIDVGRLENGAPYMVMEYLEGHDLSRHYSPEPLPVDVAVDYVLQACDAMAEAHVAGIIHRDLKPANLFRTERADGSAVVKVLDFGISKVADPSISDAALTRTSTAMGSPLYMSPEQLRSAKDVDVRADIWSMGAILYELLGAQTPFTGESYPELCAEILGNPPRSLAQVRPDLPEGLEAVVLRCLEKNPDARFQNVAELANALLPYAPEHARPHAERARRVLARAGMSSIPDIEDRPPGASAPPPAPSPNTSVGRTAAAWTETGKPEQPKSKLSLWIGVALAIGLAAVGAYALGSRAPSAEPANAAPSAVDTTTAPATTTPPPVEPEPSVTPLASAEPPPSASTSAAPEPKAATRTTKTEPKRTQPEPKEAKPEPKPEPKPAPAPTPTPKKNPLDIGLK